MSKVEFPWKPYPQQEQLMKSITECIDSGGVGCFESPTGTGKSMCVLYASLSWQIQQERKLLEGECKDESVVQSNEDDDWLAEFTAKVSDNVSPRDDNKALISQYNEMKKRIKNKTTFEKLSSKRHLKSSAYVRKQNSELKENSTTSLVIDEYGVDDYDSGTENNISKSFGNTDNNDDDEEVDNNNKQLKSNPNQWKYTTLIPKIFYCSRTHSQIAQFVSEIKKSSFHDIRCVTLSSRKNLCIHEKLQDHSDSYVTEECQNMQKLGKKVEQVVYDHDDLSGINKNESVNIHTKKNKNIHEVSPLFSTNNSNHNRKATTTATDIKSDGNITNDTTSTTNNNNNKYKKKVYEKCIYHHSGQEQQYADVILHNLYDIEEIIQYGKNYHVCPYYSTRQAIYNAQIICVPYNMLLSYEMRESLGLDIKNNIIIFDEAHNVVDTMNQLYSISLEKIDFISTYESISIYLQKYKLLLNGKNRYYIQLFQSIIYDIHQYILKQAPKFSLSSPIAKNTNNTNTNITTDTTTTTATTTATDILHINDFLFQCNIDNINFFKLIRYLDRTLIIQKMAGYTQRYEYLQYQAQVRVPTSQQDDKILMNTMSMISPIPISTTTATTATTTDKKIFKSPLQMTPIQTNKAYPHKVTPPPPNTTTHTSPNTATTNNNKNINNNNVSKSAEYNANKATQIIGSFRRIIQLLKCFTHANQDGRIYIQHIDNNTHTTTTTTTNTTTVSISSNSSINSNTNNKISPTLTTMNSDDNKSNISKSYKVQYIMLNSSYYFQSLIEEARSVILLGGTLQPFSYMISQLFPKLPSYRLRLFTCNHIVPCENISTYIISTNTNMNHTYDFTHKYRSTSQSMIALYECIFQYSQIIPYGLVIFFTSYQYMNDVMQYFKKHTPPNSCTNDTDKNTATNTATATSTNNNNVKGKTMNTMYDYINQYKQIYMETKDANISEQVWLSYQQYIYECLQKSKCSSNTTIKSSHTYISNNISSSSSSRSNISNNITGSNNSSNGAILCCVMGGKLSEGINFSNELARGVLVVGMPYPDTRDQLLQLKLQYHTQQMMMIQSTQSTQSMMQDNKNTANISMNNMNDGGSNKENKPYIDNNHSSLSMPITTLATGSYTQPHNYIHNQSSMSNSQPTTGVLSSKDGHNFFETLCMKVVNQSIGRSIRHIHDYAVIILLDTRYTRTSTLSLLPQWIRQSVYNSHVLHDSYKSIESFFENKL